MAEIEEHLDEELLQEPLSVTNETTDESIDDVAKSIENENEYNYELIEQESNAIASEPANAAYAIDNELQSKSNDNDTIIYPIDETEIARMQLESLERNNRKRKSDCSDAETSDSSSNNHQRIHIISSIVMPTDENPKQNKNDNEKTPKRSIPIRNSVPGTIEIPKELILGTQDVTSPIIFSPENNTSCSRTLLNEDLIAILEGGDDDDDENDEVVYDIDAKATAATDDEPIEHVKEIEEHQKEPPSTPPSPPHQQQQAAAAKHSPTPKPTVGPLSKDLERRIAMEQMMALPTKRQGRKQKLVAKDITIPAAATTKKKKSAASDLVSSLVSEWSDNESKSENNDAALAPVVEAVAIATEIPPIAVAPIKKSTKTTNSTSTSTTEIKKQLNSIPPATLFKRSRIIKKKVIWDPDAPETAISYASFVNSSPSALSSSKKKPKIEKEQILPTEDLSSKQQAAAANTIESVSKKKTTVKSDLPSKNKRETAAISLAAKKRKSSDSPSSINRKKKVSEIDKLLGDEGAANMLNALKQDSSNDNNGADISDAESNKSETRSSSKFSSTGQEIKPTEQITLNRGRQRTMVQKQPATTAAKKDKESSVNAIKKRSPTKKSPASSWDYIYSSRPDDSMIIRRRSNSSYSSTTSPNRLSVELTPTAAATNSKATPTATTTTPIAATTKSNANNKKPKGNKEKFEFAKPNAKKLSKDNNQRSAAAIISEHSIVNDLNEIIGCGETNETSNRRSKRGQNSVVVVVDSNVVVGQSVINDVNAHVDVNKKPEQKDCYEELLLKRHKNFVEILLAPETSKDENVFTIQVNIFFGICK